jgi:hypothetical protein
MSASALVLRRTVVGSKSSFFIEGVAFTVPSAGTASGIAKPGITDAGWTDPGPLKWNEDNTSKTEEYMSAQPGAYVVEDEIVLSKGLKFTAKLEKQSPLAIQLQRSTALLAATAGAVYNPLGGSPVVRAWVHVQKYNQDNVLIDTADLWCAIKAGKTNNDDKAAETDITATVLFSTLNVGSLA